MQHMENVTKITPQELAAHFDHTLLKPEATTAQIELLCQEARELGCATVCVNPSMLALAASALESSQVLPITVVGFPLGAVPASWKVEETKRAIDMGAREVDMVINIGRFLAGAGSSSALAEEVGRVCEVARDAGVPVKVIIETALLSPEHIKEAARICANAGADFVKTSTGFAARGASLDDIALMAAGIKESRNPGARIKASGGIKTLDQALAMIRAGAHRIGSSNTVSIVKELTGRK
ncbi:MAG: hypothetical protein RIQ81_2594 [Pseudomonadota bacterium]